MCRIMSENISKIKIEECKMKCKRVAIILLALVTVVSTLSMQVFAENEIKVLLDGQELIFDVPPQLIDNRTMVPMRKIFEAMGANVDWNGDTQTVTATKDDITVIMQIDNKVIKVNGENITLDVPPQLVDSRTLVPARAVAESLNAKVDWDGTTSTVYITSPNKALEETYKYPNPTIDFSKDDGVMSQLHLDLRLMFEQSVFPESLYANAETLKDSIVNDPEEFLAYVDNELWGKSMTTVIIRYMTESDEEFVITSEEDIYKYLNNLSDKYSLHAYQNYEVDAVKLSNDKYLILFSMADIYNDLKVAELDKMLLSNYIAVVYNANNEKFSYYLLEKSLDGNYVVCSINEKMEHTTYGVVKNDKKAFVENVIFVNEN